MHYVFDIDGTLTPSRGKMDKEFSNWFEHFATHDAVYLVTGSDRDKTIEQVGNQIYNLSARVYNCSGNDVYQQDQSVYRTDWKLPPEALKWLKITLINSPFSLRTGNHIEERPGCANFSIVGRNCTLGERKMYVKYDELNKEREDIARQFNYVFGPSSVGLRAVIGGETGLDIFPIGCDKSQIIKDFPNEEIIFFGDKMDRDGNDYPLAHVNKGTNHHVKDWKHTWDILKEYA